MAKTTGIAQFSQGRSDIHKVDPRLLTIEPGWNTREEGPELDAHIDMLAQSIAEVGVKVPISVKLINDVLVVRSGHCRTRATIRAIEHYGADIKTVPVIPFDRFANDADMVLDQIISNSGKPFAPIEQARVFKKLLDMGWEQVQIAKRVGLSSGRVSQLLDLLTMPASVQALVATGAVSASLAQATVKAADTPQEAATVLTQAAEAAMSEDRKVKPADVGNPQASNGKQHSGTIKECFENSDIDNSDPDTGFVMIKMPIEDWEVVRKVFKL